MKHAQELNYQNYQLEHLPNEADDTKEHITPLLKKEKDRREMQEALMAKGRTLQHEIFATAGAQSVKITNQETLEKIYRSLCEKINDELLHLPNNPSQGIELITQTIIKCNIAEEFSKTVIETEKKIRIEHSDPNRSIDGTLVDLLRRSVNSCLIPDRVSDHSMGTWRGGKSQLPRTNTRWKNSPKGTGNSFDFEQDHNNLGTHEADSK